MDYGIQQGYNPLTSTAYASSLYASQPGLYAAQPGQPAMFGGAQAPFGGLMGSGIGGLFGGQNIGRQPGQVIDGIGGMYQPSTNIDPLTAAHIQQAQQAQLAQQHVAQLVQQAQLAQLPQLGRWSPFGVDPISAALAQRAQIAQQVGFAPGFGIPPLNRIDPLTAAYIQQAQVAQLVQQLTQQSQLGQPGYGNLGPIPFNSGQFNPGAGQFNPGGWPGVGPNLWANPQLASLYARPFGLGAGAGLGGPLSVY